MLRVKEGQPKKTHKERALSLLSTVTLTFRIQPWDDVTTTRKPRPGQDLPESYYKNPNGHKRLTEAFPMIFGLSKYAWGIADKDGEYPDLVLKTAPFFANASNKNRPPLEHLNTALTLMFGERRFEYEKDDLLWFFEYFQSHYANWAEIAPSAKVYIQWIKDYHQRHR